VSGNPPRTGTVVDFGVGVRKAMPRVERTVNRAERRIPSPSSESHHLEAMPTTVPSRLLAWRSERSVPSTATILEAVGGREVEVLPAVPPVRWAAAVHPPDPGRPTRLIWFEDADPVATPEAPEGVATAAMVVGIESLLPPIERGDPLDAWLELARAVGGIAGAGPILDPITGRWFGPEERRRWLDGPDADPPDEILWSVRASRRRDGRGAWLLTEGLARLGRAELEMLEVPDELADAGAALLDALAALSLEAEPPVGEGWSIGPGLVVTVQSPVEVLETVDAASVGSSVDRRGLDGVRSLAVCGAEPRGTYRRIWTAPSEVLRRVAEGAAMHRSGRVAARQQRLAQRHLALLERSLGGSGRRVLIAATEAGAEGPPCWGEVEGVVGSRFAMRPVDLSGRPAIAEPERIVAPSEVADWRVEIAGAVHGPEEASRLGQVLDHAESPASDGDAT